jgi:hypothetical protein
MPSSASSDMSNLIYGAKIARVSVSRAIVYSDESMNSPLGYISSGKLITIGNPRKRNPDLAPLVVYGRLAFIELKNIQYEDEATELQNSKMGAPREHNIDNVLEKPEELLNKNNSAFFYLQQFRDSKLEGDKNYFLGFGAGLIHRKPLSPYFWGLGLEYNTNTNKDVTLNFTTLNPMIGLTPLRTPAFFLDLYFTYDFSIGSNFKIEENYVNETAPFFYGPTIATRVVLFPNSPYQFTGVLGYRSYTVKNAEKLYLYDTEVDGFTQAQGLILSLGLSLAI